MKVYRAQLLSFLLIIVSFFSGWSQEVGSDSLFLDDLIRIAIEKNHQIKIARIQKRVADNNASAGNAGLTPEVVLESGAEYSRNNTNISFASSAQPEINATNATSQNYNAGLRLNYTLYSGGRNRYVFKQLREGGYQQQLRLRSQMETTILEVLQNYLSYRLQKEAYQLDLKALEISNDRIKRARNNYEFGAFSRLEVLNAEVDLRKDSTAWLQSKIAHQKTYHQLMNSLGLPPDSNLTIGDSFEVDEDLSLDELKNKALQQNANYLLSESIVRTQELQLKISKSRWLPQLDISAAYLYNYQNNEAGFIQTQENYGFNGGISLRYPLYQGGNRSRSAQNEALNLEAGKDQLEAARIDLQTELLNAFEDYQAGLQLMSLSERNIDVARKNYERSTEAYQNGQINGLSLREAQLNYLNSIYLFQSHRVQTKIAEASLLFLTGSLVE